MSTVPSIRSSKDEWALRSDGEERQLVGLDQIASRSHGADERRIRLARAEHTLTIHGAPEQRGIQPPALALESSQLSEVGFDIERNCIPAQTLVAAPRIEGRKPCRGLRRIFCIEVVAFLRRHQDPGDHRNSGPIQPAYELCPFRTEVGNGDPDAGVQVLQVRDDAGVGEQRPHLAQTVIATGKEQPRGHSRPSERGCRQEDWKPAQKPRRSGKRMRRAQFGAG
jgi:hypothetical protein